MEATKLYLEMVLLEDNHQITIWLRYLTEDLMEKIQMELIIFLLIVSLATLQLLV